MVASDFRVHQGKSKGTPRHYLPSLFAQRLGNLQHPRIYFYKLQENVSLSLQGSHNLVRAERTSSGTCTFHLKARSPCNQNYRQTQTSASILTHYHIHIFLGWSSFSPHNPKMVVVSTRRPSIQNLSSHFQPQKSGTQPHHRRFPSHFTPTKTPQCDKAITSQLGKPNPSPFLAQPYEICGDERNARWSPNRHIQPFSMELWLVPLLPHHLPTHHKS